MKPFKRPPDQDQPSTAKERLGTLIPIRRVEYKTRKMEDQDTWRKARRESGLAAYEAACETITIGHHGMKAWRIYGSVEMVEHQALFRAAITLYEDMTGTEYDVTMSTAPEGTRAAPMTLCRQANINEHQLQMEWCAP